MVDVSAKPATIRKAVAVSEIRMNAAAADQVRSGESRKGDVLAVARLAAISGCKWTPQLIPLCHGISVESVTVDFEWAKPPAPHQAGQSQRLVCRVTCITSAKTGVEMEAMTAATVAGLTVYDMLKSVDRGMQIGPTRLLEKTGGKSGHYVADDPLQAALPPKSGDGGSPS
jgi:cyclic pyranopterin phosphate synthase